MATVIAMAMATALATAMATAMATATATAMAMAMGTAMATAMAMAMATAMAMAMAMAMATAMAMAMAIATATAMVMAVATASATAMVMATVRLRWCDRMSRDEVVASGYRLAWMVESTPKRQPFAAQASAMPRRRFSLGRPRPPAACSFANAVVFFMLGSS